MSEGLREFTLEELKEFDGRDGKPAYVAYDQKVFDITASKRWKNGSHMNRHAAGNDLTDDIAAAPHQPDVLERFPQIGTLKPDKDLAGPRLPLFFEVMLDAFPMLRRHPHPMTVHFPIVFMISTSIFTFLYVTTGIASFETTAYHVLGAGVLFIFVGMTTGLSTWWLNYMARPILAVIIKLVLSTLMLMIAIVAFVWRTINPHVLDDLSGVNLIYLLSTLSLFPIVSVVGWFGAS
ncbi:MAG: DUF2231 domain-containing protein, partial [Pseudomonadota bacterium]